MTTKLPPYTGDNPTCLKCGHVGARTRYCEQGEPRIGDTFGLNTPRDQRAERLERQCSRCGYVWDEALNNTAGSQQ